MGGMQLSYQTRPKHKKGCTMSVQPYNNIENGGLLLSYLACMQGSASCIGNAVNIVACGQVLHR